jgi:hypothetical protein
MIMKIDVQTLIEWNDRRKPKSYKKQSIKGWIAAILIAVSVVCFFARKVLPFLYPFVAICSLVLGIAFFIWGTIRYKIDAARLDEDEKFCGNCGKGMEEVIIDMPKDQLPTARLSRIDLMHKLIKRDKLFEGSDRRIYMTGKKKFGSDPGYVDWVPTVFLLKQKWFVCFDCKCSFVQDTRFEPVGGTVDDVEALKNRKRLC